MFMKVSFLFKLLRGRKGVSRDILRRVDSLGWRDKRKR